MTHLFCYRLLTSFLLNISGKFDFLMLCGDIESNAVQIQGLIPIKASQFVTGISIA